MTPKVLKRGLGEAPGRSGLSQSPGVVFNIHYLGPAPKIPSPHEKKYCFGGEGGCFFFCAHILRTFILVRRYFG